MARSISYQPGDQRGARPGDGARPDASSSWARTSPAAPARPARTTPGAACSASPRACTPSSAATACSTRRSPRAAFIGAAVGAAATGLRPVAELMFVDFMGVCFDQIFNQAAKFRYMFGGKAMTPDGRSARCTAPGIRAAAQHSPVPLPDVHPHPRAEGRRARRTPYDAKGLLIQAIRDDDPVIFFEHKVLYDDEGDVPEERLRDPVRRGQHRARGRRRHDRRDRAHGAARRAGGRRAGRARASSARSSTRARPRRSTARRSSRASRTPAGWSSSTRPTRAAAWPPTSSALVAAGRLRRRSRRRSRWSPRRTRRCRSARSLEDAYVPSPSKIAAAVRDDGRAQRRRHDRRSRSSACPSGACR